MIIKLNISQLPSDCNKEVASPHQKGRLSEGNHGCPRNA